MKTVGRPGPLPSYLESRENPPALVGIGVCLPHHDMLVKSWDSDPVSPLPGDAAFLDKHLFTVHEITLDACRRTGPFLRAKQRCAGLTLRARDVAWSAGAGPEVTGPLASIIMAIAGRPEALADLSGEGLDTLRPRL